MSCLVITYMSCGNDFMSGNQARITRADYIGVGRYFRLGGGGGGHIGMVTEIRIEFEL